MEPVEQPPFIVYPAIDLRGGQVVRLIQGDPARQTVFGRDPQAAARRWIEAGAGWLHVVNLDGAFGEGAAENDDALQAILKTARTGNCRVQFGGGLRTLESIQAAIERGVDRVILGTAAIEQPEIAEAALQAFGAQRVALGLDARGGIVRTRGWLGESSYAPEALAAKYVRKGFRLGIYTNIDLDGRSTGLDVDASASIAAHSGLAIIGSGGVAALEDVRRARQVGLAGIIIGRALYDGAIQLKEALQC
jgi:phosphoribosylformimino-5-aminoimidazole carboxamide ribotide isomerase